MLCDLHGHNNFHIRHSRQANSQIAGGRADGCAAGDSHVGRLTGRGNVKNLTGMRGYRLRVGRYRVLFDVSDDGTIPVAQVLIRNERTY
jgi:hypothetical protein